MFFPLEKELIELEHLINIIIIIHLKKFSMNHLHIPIGYAHTEAWRSSENLTVDVRVGVGSHTVQQGKHAL